MKHTPLRTCIVTRQRLPKGDLARFVYIKDQSKVVLDPGGKLRGRGANMSKSLDIFDKAVKSGAFQRAFKVKLPPDELSALREQFEKFLDREKLLNGSQKAVVRISEGSVKIGKD